MRNVVKSLILFSFIMLCSCGSSQEEFCSDTQRIGYLDAYAKTVSVYEAVIAGDLEYRTASKQIDSLELIMDKKESSLTGTDTILIDLVTARVNMVELKTEIHRLGEKRKMIR